MRCQFCGQPATVHLTDVAQQPKREMHLCDACASQHGLFPATPGPDLDLPALVALLLGQAARGADPAALTCPTCGLKYAVFRADGRLGCPDDYDAFRPALVPILEKVQRSTRHAGKRPARAVALAALHEELAAAVAAERYEDAARLRDRVRQAEGTRG